MKLSIENECEIFKTGFTSYGINVYHVLTSITFFEEAEEESSPMLIVKGVELEWDRVKDFFVKNLERFKKCLMPQG